MRTTMLLTAGALLLAVAGCSDDDDDIVNNFVCDPGAPVTVNYDDSGTFEIESIIVGGLTVNGSAFLHVLDGSGIGIVGGTSGAIDGSEFVRVDVDGNPAVDVSYVVVGSGNLDGDLLSGEATVEPLGRLGQNLGSFPVSGDGTKDVSGMVANEPIGAFRVIAAGDEFRIQSVTFTPCQ